MRFVDSPLRKEARKNLKDEIEHNNREPYFDNVKYILILLVVIGHFIEKVIFMNTSLKIVYDIIYSFHMPLFIFISGYFSKNTLKNNQKIEILSKYLVPYLVFQFFYIGFVKLTISPAENLTIFTPCIIMWYLLSLFTWYIITPYFSKIKYSLLISIILGLIVGYIPDISFFLSLSRSIAFYPFFLAGYFIKKEHLQNIIENKNRYIAIIPILLIAYIFYGYSETIHPYFLTNAFSYITFLPTQKYLFVYRILLYVAEFIMSLCVLSLIPNKEYSFTKLGKRTLYVYLLHYFVVIIFEHIGYFHLNMLVIKLTIIPIAVITTLVLSLKSIELLIKYIIEPRILFTKIKLILNN
jgi:fucose 4-O-acetylase-like acetyltransferase